MTTVLIADDNAQIVSILEEYSKKEGYRTLTAADGERALQLFRQEAPDVVLLDVMMPKLDGFAVCREIRRESDTPVIMVTARGEDFERIMGLDIGADDYIVKPFSPGEVMARIRSVLRRMQRGGDSGHVLEKGTLRVDLGNYQATLNGEKINLTKKELELLWTLASSPGRAFSRESLLNQLWGYDYFGDSRTVDSHIKRLRQKLDAHPHPGWNVATIWGVGYRFEEEDA
ncbi:MAG: response regulator transcription factor [Christensenellales bacterium]|jgi:DNA-binding response OmpR family regulator